MSKRHRPARTRQTPDRLDNGDRQRLETAFRLAMAKDRESTGHLLTRPPPATESVQNAAGQ
jgi:hypothetical protein